MKLVACDDPILHSPTAPVVGSVAGLRSVAAQMFQVMTNNGGIGLAAPQVGLGISMFIMNLVPVRRRKFRDSYVCINPEILDFRAPVTTESEGCLSWPGRLVPVSRHASILCRYTDLNGKTQTRNFFGLLARCFQHEFEHLQGINITTRSERTEAA